MRPIDADALMERLVRERTVCPDCSEVAVCIGDGCSTQAVIRAIISAPTIDAAPVRRGGCEYCNGSGRVLYQETHSAKLYLNSFGDARTIEVEANRCPPFADCAMVNVPARSAFIINFCPNCGADMRGVSE